MGKQSGGAPIVQCPTPFVLVGVWTLLEPTYDVAALMALRLCAAGVSGLPMVAMGDFNISPRVAAQRHSAPEFIRRMRGEFGLMSAYHSHHAVELGAEAHPTCFHQRKEAARFHLDYCFVPEDWGRCVRNAEVGSYADWRDSDHRPLTIELAD